MIGEVEPARRLLLWDIDGTLVRVGEIGATAFDRAVELGTGAKPTARPVMSGKTDPQIVAEYLELLELADVHRHVPVVLEHLERELAAAEDEVRSHGRLLPGVATLLARLAGDDRVLQTVLTGNIAPNALVKLAAFGLEGWLDLEVGAFGSDHADRRALVPVALGRLRTRDGVTLDPGDVWVIGDSANDLACARAAGARCLLVATGHLDVGALGSLEPDALLPDLSDTEAVIELLLA